jgi:hypothetical protein
MPGCGRTGQRRRYIHVISIYGPAVDIANLHEDVPSAPLVLAESASDPERPRSCAGAIAGRLPRAKSPAIPVDQDVDRYGAAAEVVGWPRDCTCRWRVTGLAENGGIDTNSLQPGESYRHPEGRTNAASLSATASPGSIEKA